MKIDIPEEEFRKAVVDKASNELLGKKDNWLGSYWKLRDLADEVLLKTPEIKDMVREEIKKCLQDKSFLHDAIRQIFIEELKEVEPDD